MFELQDKKATLIINHYVDKVMKALMDGLGLPIPSFTGKPWWTTSTPCKDINSPDTKDEVKDSNNDQVNNCKALCVKRFKQDHEEDDDK